MMHAGRFVLIADYIVTQLYTFCKYRDSKINEETVYIDTNIFHTNDIRCLKVIDLHDCACVHNCGFI